jgi:hypothetical protein
MATAWDMKRCWEPFPVLDEIDCGWAPSENQVEVLRLSLAQRRGGSGVLNEHPHTRLSTLMIGSFYYVHIGKPQRRSRGKRLDVPQ